jgi:hypothetical protein
MRPYLCLFSALIFGLLSLTASQAQTPAPVIIQAVTPAPEVAKPVAAAQAQGAPSALQLLQEMQAANAATILKQDAALATLDELQKAAEEIKIFSKRG